MRDAMVPFVPAQDRRALFLRRLQALVSDRLIVGALVFILALVRSTLGANALGLGPTLWEWPGHTHALLVTAVLFLYGLPSVAYAFLILAYVMYFIVRHGRTWGMAGSGLEVVAADGGPPHPARVLVWHAASIVSGLALGMGYLWMLIDPEARTWHDRIAGIRVQAAAQTVAGAEGSPR
jgi:uncharacterized RDD family membrane protein YckC